MAQVTSSTDKILVAVPAAWNEMLCQFLERDGFSVLLVSSIDEALSAIQVEDFRAIVMISNWAMASEETDGLMSIVKGKIPTVSLITQTTWKEAHYRWFAELYHPPLHEYCSVPVAMEQLSLRLKGVIEAALSNCLGE